MRNALRRIGGGIRGVARRLSRSAASSGGGRSSGT
jgi:hypothetical protein